FVIPYPPGFPVLVPGQVISKDILDFMLALDVKEIHGYRPALGLSVFTEEALGKVKIAETVSAITEIVQEEQELQKEAKKPASKKKKKAAKHATKKTTETSAEPNAPD
ncbi:MAG: hypothetical protein WBM71_12135, partial [Sedimenticolaceae bacterium]